SRRDAAAARDHHSHRNRLRHRALGDRRDRAGDGCAGTAVGRSGARHGTPGRRQATRDLPARPGGRALAGRRAAPAIRRASAPVVGLRRAERGTRMAEINSLFENLLNIGLGVAVAVAAFFVMWGAFLYMSASGSPRQMESGKTAIVNALTGLAIVLLARVIAGMVQSARGTGAA